MLFSSQENTSGDEIESVKGFERGIKRDKTPSLLESLALCYLGAMLLRLPFNMGNLYRCVCVRDLMFLVFLVGLLGAIDFIMLHERANVVGEWNTDGPCLKKSLIYDLYDLYRET